MPLNMVESISTIQDFLLLKNPPLCWLRRRQDTSSQTQKIWYTLCTIPRTGKSGYVGKAQVCCYKSEKAGNTAVEYYPFSLYSYPISKRTPILLLHDRGSLTVWVWGYPRPFLFCRKMRFKFFLMYRLSSLCRGYCTLASSHSTTSLFSMDFWTSIVR